MYLEVFCAYICLFLFICIWQSQKFTFESFVLIKHDLYANLDVLRQQWKHLKLQGPKVKIKETSSQSSTMAINISMQQRLRFIVHRRSRREAKITAKRNIGHDVEAPTGLGTPQKISSVEKKWDCGGGARCGCDLRCIINITWHISKDRLNNKDTDYMHILLKECSEKTTFILQKKMKNWREKNEEEDTWDPHSFI